MSDEVTIDCCVRALPVSDEELWHYMEPPFRGKRLGSPFGIRYLPPIPDIHPTACAAADYGTGSGSDTINASVHPRDAIATTIFDGLGADMAILMPPNFFLRADIRHDVAVASAMNEWIMATWLSGSYGERFRASIQVSVWDPRAAVREIEKWATNSQFVQVAVPMHVEAPYGDERYFPIWETAEQHSLPIAVHGDGGGGIEWPPTMAGFPSHFIEYHTLMPLTGMIHFASLVSEGVFERLPRLKFVFTDGGIAAALPLFWRYDSAAKALREEIPWVRHLPSEYLTRHARFVTRHLDLRVDEGTELLEQTAEGQHIRLYGSNYPMWDMLSPDLVRGAVSERLRSAIMGGNALATYPRLTLGEVG